MTMVFASCFIYLLRPGFFMILVKIMFSFKVYMVYLSPLLPVMDTSDACEEHIAYRHYM